MVWYKEIPQKNFEFSDKCSMWTKMLKYLKKKRVMVSDWFFGELGGPNPLWLLTIAFLISYRATLIFKVSQSDLFIKSYDYLKFCLTMTATYILNQLQYTILKSGF